MPVLSTLDEDHGAEDAEILRRELRAQWSWTAFMAAACLVVWVPVLVGFGMESLREAHLYRQRSNEGLKFMWPMADILGALTLSLVAAGLMFASKAIAGQRVWRFVAAVVGVSLLAALAATGALLYVGNLKDRCFGTCG